MRWLDVLVMFIILYTRRRPTRNAAVVWHNDQSYPDMGVHCLPDSIPNILYIFHASTGLLWLSVNLLVSNEAIQVTEE